MNDTTEFTPKEQYLISLYKDPQILFRMVLTRSLYYLIPSLGLVAYAYVSDDLAYGIIGYALLVFKVLHGLNQQARGAESVSSIIHKYEARLQNTKDTA